MSDLSDKPSTTESFKRWMRESTTFKVGCIGFITLLLLIPVTMISGLVSERESARDEVVRDISTKWGGPQTLTGPVLTVPVTVREKTGETEKVVEVTRSGNAPVEGKPSGETKTVTEPVYSTRTVRVHFLPEELTVDGQLTAKTRYRSIYEVLLYGSKLSFHGQFTQPKFEQFDMQNAEVEWERATVAVGISDLTGIRDEVQLAFGGQDYEFNPSLPSKEVVQSGISVPVDLQRPSPDMNAAPQADDASPTYAFDFDLRLNGRKQLHVVPVGKTTKVHLESDHPSPSFDGNFLPDTRTIDETGFAADWSVLDLNRNFPQQWHGDAYHLNSSAFGVELVTPVDHYQKSDRSTKYGFLFIFLTFTVFFFAEFLNDNRIHPLQYLMVGAGICVFYVLLIALSEHIGFNLSFLAASTGIIGLITGYSKSILDDGVLTAIVGTSLVGLYAFLFTILQLEMYALLIGSLGLFIVLAAVMYLSRNVDWYRRSSRDGSV